MLRTLTLILTGLIPMENGGLSPELKAPVRLEAAGKPIDTDIGHAAPFVCDFDGDGVKDLLVGQFGDGLLWIYRNKGTNSEPKLAAGVKFKEGKEDGRVPSGWCIGFGPHAVDLNHDGYMDILSGSWPGEIFLFKGGPDHTFSAPEMLKYKDGEIINIGGGIREERNPFPSIGDEKQAETMILITGSAEFEHTAEGTFVNYHGQRIESTPEKPVAITGTASAAQPVDWDGDGDYDLIIGDIRGAVYLVPNEGTPQSYAFGKERRIVKVSGRAGPYAADWDGDGDLDLLVGDGNGSVSLFENTGDNKSPTLASAVQLVPPGEKASGSEAPKDVRRGTRSKICVTDWNGDGRLDLLVGDLAAQKPDLPEPTPDEKAEQERIRKKLETIEKQHSDLLQKLHGPSRVKTTEEIEQVQKELEEVRKHMTELHSKLPPEYDRHGWVWLFLRKGI